MKNFQFSPVRWTPFALAGFALLACQITLDCHSVRAQTVARAVAQTAPQNSSSAPRPNVLLILADDLGFCDLGCYGGEIQTPVLDSIAQRGLRFTQFTNTGRCWPTRASLLTGFYAQSITRDKLYQSKKGGNSGRRPDWAPLLPRRLRDVGYRNYHAGKWHLDGDALPNGFDRAYRQNGNYFRASGATLDDVRIQGESPDDFYYTTEVANRSIDFLKEHAQQHADKPFFQYLAFTAPHFPLHATPDDIAVYKGVYDAGWDVIRRQRFESMTRLALFGDSVKSPSQPMRNLGPPYDFPDAFPILGDGEVNKPIPWSDLNETQRAFQAAKMEIHAAMVHRMDLEIGRVMQQIESMGQLDNTLVMFLSDNGASAEIMVRGGGHDAAQPLGSEKTYLCLGPGWSTVCNTPFRRHKTWTHEGGVATPLVMSWPAGIRARGEMRRTPGHVVDIVPTILELAGLPSIADIPGRPIPGQLGPRPSGPREHGKSLVPAFRKDITIDRDSIWWLHDDHRAIRLGDWKAVSAKGEPWELYNLEIDRAETNDLAKVEPGRLEMMAAFWQQQHDILSRMAEKGGSL